MYQGQTAAAARVRWGFSVAAAATRLACDEMTRCERSRLLFPPKKPEGGAGQHVRGRRAPERGAWRQGRALGVGVGHSGKRAAAGAHRGAAAGGT